MWGGCCGAGGAGFQSGLEHAAVWSWVRYGEGPWGPSSWGGVGTKGASPGHGGAGVLIGGVGQGWGLPCRGELWGTQGQWKLGKGAKLWVGLGSLPSPIAL